MNDSPVNLKLMEMLGSQLIDIHSQHQTLELAEDVFQFKVLDALAGIDQEMTTYQQTLSEYKKVQRTLSELKHFQSEASKEQDYNLFLLNELIEAQLQKGAQEALEEEYSSLNNVEEIRMHLTKAYQILQHEEIGVLQNLLQAKASLLQIAGFSETLKSLTERIDSVSIELDDIFQEIQGYEEQIEADPQRLATVNAKLQTLYDLQKKHNVATVDELIEITEVLQQKVSAADNADADIAAVAQQLEGLSDTLNDLALQIHNKRMATIPALTSQLEGLLESLGMGNARFQIALQKTEDFMSNGKDAITFLLSANKGSSYGPLKKVASGGELSRIMLCIKAILSAHTKLPSIIFDEIDTGVSGAISDKVADIMKQMSHRMQVFSITHLPQVAAKGHQHYKVYKTDVDDQTTSHLKQLNPEERIVEIAQMLGGVDITESAMAHARQLLN